MTPLLRIRIALSLTGLLLAGLAVALDDRRFTWAALGVLGAALVVRFVVPRLIRPKDEPPAE